MSTQLSFVRTSGQTKDQLLDYDLGCVQRSAYFASARLSSQVKPFVQFDAPHRDIANRLQFFTKRVRYFLTENFYAAGNDGE